MLFFLTSLLSWDSAVGNRTRFVQGNNEANGELLMMQCMNNNILLLLLYAHLNDF